MIYRVMIKISYYERYFDFEEAQEAVSFAETILARSVISEDCKQKPTYVNISVMTKETAYNTNAEEED